MRLICRSTGIEYCSFFSIVGWDLMQSVEDMRGSKDPCLLTKELLQPMACGLNFSIASPLASRTTQRNLQK